MSERASGVLLHPTSLSSPYGIGSLGPEAFQFADWLTAAGQRIWQVLPLGPTGYGESPYALFSAFAGNPLLISPKLVMEQGWLDAADLKESPSFPAGTVDFERLIPWKMKLLRKAFQRFRPCAAYEQFIAQEGAWLDEYARFMALKRAAGGVDWHQWPEQLEPDPDEIAFERFVQYEFFREWRALKAHANGLGVRIMGDVPIYVAGDSADVWAHPELFRFDFVSGVPPDYFSATGQLWGNPVYRWDRMAADGYAWWVDRMRAAFAMFDLVRLDHFRGFEAFWEVPASETTAVNGRWAKGPGSELFHVLRQKLGGLPLVAENLGVITPEVEAIRHEFGFPGMAVLQFAFGNDAQARDFQPHNYVREVVAYTGTHDNDTVMGWWRSTGGDSTRSADDVRQEKSRALAYLGASPDAPMNQVLIRTLMASVADTVIFPVQDLLGLGSESRMNTPSVASGNWRWRMANPLDADRAEWLRSLTELYERAG
jgi:4-alpha-glucanotransferase